MDYNDLYTPDSLHRKLIIQHMDDQHTLIYLVDGVSWEVGDNTLTVSSVNNRRTFPFATIRSWTEIEVRESG